MIEKKIDLNNLPITWPDIKAPPINLYVMSQWSDVLKFRQLKGKTKMTTKPNDLLIINDVGVSK